MGKAKIIIISTLALLIIMFFCNIWYKNIKAEGERKDHVLKSNINILVRLQNDLNRYTSTTSLKNQEPDKKYVDSIMQKMDFYTTLGHEDIMSGQCFKVPNDPSEFIGKIEWNNLSKQDTADALSKRKPEDFLCAMNITESSFQIYLAHPIQTPWGTTVYQYKATIGGGASNTLKRLGVQMIAMPASAD